MGDSSVGTEMSAGGGAVGFAASLLMFEVCRPLLAQGLECTWLSYIVNGVCGAVEAAGAWPSA